MQLGPEDEDLVAGENVPYFVPRIKPGSDRVARRRPYWTDIAQRSLTDNIDDQIDQEHFVTPTRSLTPQSAGECLSNLGGRLAYPVRYIPKDKSDYRKILAYWQTEPLDFSTNITERQLKRWRQFRSHQDAKRTNGNFSSYRQAVSELVTNSCVDLLPYLSHGDAGDHLDPPEEPQDKLATWIEYFCFELERYNSLKSELLCQTATWDSQWQYLCTKVDVLEDFDDLPVKELVLGRVRSHQAALEMERHRAADAAFETSHALTFSRRSRRHSNSSTAAETDYRRHQDRVNELSRRNHYLAKFLRNTAKFRKCLADVDRHDLLMQWILDQLPAIAAEVGMPSADTLYAPLWEPLDKQLLPRPIGYEAKPEPQARTNSDTRTERFVEDYSVKQAIFGSGKSPLQKLPLEIQRMIWILCLPPAPSAHFFQVVQHPRLPPLHDRWLPYEFRLRATSAYPSGYKEVYPLVGSCREARQLIWEHYTSRRDGTQTRIGPINFETLEWIPTEDLVVLCFPPEEATLPSRDAISIALGTGRPARHVGILFSRELMLTRMHGIDRNVFPSHITGRDDMELADVYPFLDGLLHRKAEADASVDPFNHQTQETGSRQDSPDPQWVEDTGGGFDWIYFIADGVQGYESAPTVQTRRPSRPSLELTEGLDLARSRPVHWLFKEASESSPGNLQGEDHTTLDWSRPQYPGYLNRRPAEVGEYAASDGGDTEEASDKRHVWWMGNESQCLALLEPGDAVQADFCNVVFLTQFLSPIALYHKTVGREVLGLISETPGCSIKMSNQRREDRS